MDDHAKSRGLPPVVRAAILLANVLDVPALGPAVRSLTREPRKETFEIDGVPVELVRPGGSGPWPGWVFVNGAHPLRRREPVVERLAIGLARAGYLVVNPDLPGLGEGELTQRTLETTIAVTEAAVALPDVRSGRVALCGVSAGASLALLTAQQPALADRITVVAAVTPWADLRRIVLLATTRHYDENGRLVPYPVTPLLRRVIARSIVAALSAGDDRELLLVKLRRIENHDGDPGEELGQLDGVALRPETQAVVDLLVNDDPSRFDGLYAALPVEVLSLIGTLSPLGEAGRLRAPVELVRPPVDEYFPLREARDLASALPRARLTVTSTLDHTRPSLTLDHVADFAHFNGFVVRGLAAAVS
jgi:acetyl esterase/lipase